MLQVITPATTRGKVFKFHTIAYILDWGKRLETLKFEEITMKDERKLAYYFKRYSASLQNVTYKKFGKFFHDNSFTPSQLIYLCPLCLRNKIGVVSEYLHYDEDFSLYHFPPAIIGGKNTILVCKSCNEQAGLAFDFSLKEWLNVQSFNKQIPNSKLPIKLKLENAKGN